MGWVIASVGLAGAGLAQNYMNAQQQQKQQKAQMMAQAAQTQFSPWTHAGIQTVGSNAPDPMAAGLGGAAAGALSGAMMGSQFKKMGDTTDTPPAGTLESKVLAQQQMPIDINNLPQLQAPKLLQPEPVSPFTLMARK